MLDQGWEYTIPQMFMTATYSISQKNNTVNKHKLFKKVAIFQHLTKVGCFHWGHLKAASKESDEFIK